MSHALVTTDTRPASSLERIASWASNGRAVLSQDILDALSPALNVKPNRSEKGIKTGNKNVLRNYSQIPRYLTVDRSRPHTSAELRNDDLHMPPRSRSSVGVHAPFPIKTASADAKTKMPVDFHPTALVSQEPLDLNSQSEDLQLYKERIDFFESSILEMEQRLGMKLRDDQISNASYSGADTIPRNSVSDSRPRLVSVSILDAHTSSEIDAYLREYTHESKRPRAAVEIQKWWRMTISRVKYRRFRRAIVLFQNRFAMLCLKHWRWVCVAEDILRHRVIGRPLWAWRQLSRNTLIWDEETAIIFLECARVRGVPQRSLFTEVSDKDIFVRAGKEHNYGQGYKFGRPLKTREHVLVVQLIRRVLIKNAKARLMRWRKRAMWSLDQIDKGRVLLESAAQRLKRERLWLSVVMWHRIARVHSCAAKLEPTPAFDPKLTVWDKWLHAHENKKRLQSDQVAAIRSRFYCRTMWLRWIGARDARQQKYAVKRLVADHYKKRLLSKCIGMWHEEDLERKAAKHRLSFILRRISAAAHLRLTRRGIGRVIHQRRAKRLLRPAFTTLKTLATSMLVIRAGSAKRLADHTVRGLWALCAWVQISASPEDEDGRQPGGLLMMGICDAHFAFVDCWRRWIAKARRRFQFRDFIRLRYPEHVLKPTLQPVVMAWRAACHTSNNKESKHSRRLPQHRIQLAATFKQSVMESLDPLLTARIVALCVLNRKRANALAAAIEEVHMLSPSERAAAKAQDYMKLLSEVTPTGGGALRSFLEKERYRSTKVREERMEALDRDYKILLAKELQDALRAFGQVYNTEYNISGEHPNFKMDQDGPPVDDDPLSPSQDWFPEFPDVVLTSPSEQPIPKKGSKRFIVDDPASPLMIWLEQHSEVSPFIAAVLMLSKGVEPGRSKAKVGTGKNSSSPASKTSKIQAPKRQEQNLKVASDDSQHAQTGLLAGETIPQFQSTPESHHDVGTQDLLRPDSASMWDYENNQRRIEQGIEAILRQTQEKLLAGEEAGLPVVSKSLMEDIPDDPYFNLPKDERLAILSETYCVLRDKELGPESTLILLDDAEGSLGISKSDAVIATSSDDGSAEFLNAGKSPKGDDAKQTDLKDFFRKAVSRSSSPKSRPSELLNVDPSPTFHGIDLTIDLSVPKNGRKTSMIENDVSATSPSPTPKSAAPTYLHRTRSMIIPDKYLIASLQNLEKKDDLDPGKINNLKSASSVASDSLLIQEVPVKTSDMKEAKDLNNSTNEEKFSRSVSIWSDNGSIGEPIAGTTDLNGEHVGATARDFGSNTLASVNLQSEIVCDAVPPVITPESHVNLNTTIIRTTSLDESMGSSHRQNDFDRQNENVLKAKPLDEKEVIWKGLMEENQWVLSEAHEIKQAMKGGLDSLYWRSKVMSKRSKRQLEVQAAIEKDFHISRQIHAARQAKSSEGIWANDMVEVISNLRPASRGSIGDTLRSSNRTIGNKPNMHQGKVKSTRNPMSEQNNNESEYCDFGRISTTAASGKLNKAGRLPVSGSTQNRTSSGDVYLGINNAVAGPHMYPHVARNSAEELLYPLKINVKLSEKGRNKNELPKAENELNLKSDDFLATPTISQPPARPTSVLEGLQIRANTSRPSSVAGISLQTPNGVAHSISGRVSLGSSHTQRASIRKALVGYEDGDSILKRARVEERPATSSDILPRMASMRSSNHDQNLDALSVNTTKETAPTTKKDSFKDAHLIVGLAHVRMRATQNGSMKSKKSALAVFEPMVRSLSLPGERKGNGVRDHSLTQDSSVKSLDTVNQNASAAEQKLSDSLAMQIKVSLHKGVESDTLLTENPDSKMRKENLVSDAAGDMSVGSFTYGVSAVNPPKIGSELEHDQGIFSGKILSVMEKVAAVTVKESAPSTDVSNDDEILWRPWTGKSASAILEELKISAEENISSLESLGPSVSLPSDVEISVLEEKYMHKLSDDYILLCQSDKKVSTLEESQENVADLPNVNTILSQLEVLSKLQNHAIQQEFKDHSSFTKKLSNDEKALRESPVTESPQILKVVSTEVLDGSVLEGKAHHNVSNNSKTQESKTLKKKQAKAKIKIQESLGSAPEQIVLKSNPVLLLTTQQIKIPIVPRSRQSRSRTPEDFFPENARSGTFSHAVLDPRYRDPVADGKNSALFSTRKASVVEKPSRRASRGFSPRLFEKKTSYVEQSQQIREVVEALGSESLGSANISLHQNNSGISCKTVNQNFKGKTVHSRPRSSARSSVSEINSEHSESLGPVVKKANNNTENRTDTVDMELQRGKIVIENKFESDGAHNSVSILKLAADASLSQSLDQTRFAPDQTKSDIISLPVSDTSQADSKRAQNKTNEGLAGDNLNRKYDQSVLKRRTSIYSTAPVESVSKKSDLVLQQDSDHHLKEKGRALQGEDGQQLKSQSGSLSSTQAKQSEVSTISPPGPRRSRRGSDYAVHGTRDGSNVLSKPVPLNRASTTTSLHLLGFAGSNESTSMTHPEAGAENFLLEREVSLEELLRSNIKKPARSSSELFDSFEQDAEAQAGDHDFVQYVSRAVSIAGDLNDPTRLKSGHASTHETRAVRRPLSTIYPSTEQQNPLELSGSVMHQASKPGSPLAALRPKSPHASSSQSPRVELDTNDSVDAFDVEPYELSDQLGEFSSGLDGLEGAGRRQSASGLVPLDLFSKIPRQRPTKNNASKAPWNSKSVSQVPTLAQRPGRSTESDDELSENDEPSDPAPELYNVTQRRASQSPGTMLLSQDSVTHWSASSTLSLAREVDRRFETLRLKRLTVSGRRASKGPAFAESSSSSEEGTAEQVSLLCGDECELEDLGSTPAAESLRAALLMGHHNVTPSGTYDARLRGIRTRLRPASPSAGDKDTGGTSISGSPSRNQSRPATPEALLKLPSTYAPRPGEILHDIPMSEVRQNSEAGGGDQSSAALVRKVGSEAHLRPGRSSARLLEGLASGRAGVDTSFRSEVPEIRPLITGQ